MDIFRKVFMSAAVVQEPLKGSYEWKKEHLTPEQLKRTMDNENIRKHGVMFHNGYQRIICSCSIKSGIYSSEGCQIPAIPSDIGYSSGKDTGGKKKSGVVSQVMGNPGVILGMGLTTLALLGMFRSSFIGDKLGAQKYMRYRIIAQFFTVTALVAGVTIFGATYEEESVVKSRQDVQKS